jgi:Zn-dependent protease
VRVVQHQQQQIQVWVQMAPTLFLAASRQLVAVQETVLTESAITAVLAVVAAVLQHLTKREELEYLEKETLVEQEKLTRVAVDSTDLLLVAVVLAQ